MQELNIGDAFKKGGPFADNIRISIDGGDDDELRESMKAHGWVEEFPALSDEYDKILIGGRRLKIAKELGINPVIKKLVFGDGDEADAKRLRLAIVSNIGHKPMTKADRQRIAEYLYGEREWSEQRIADALGVTQKTISKDLEGIYTEGINQKPAKTKTNPKGAGRPKGKKKPDKAPKEHYKQPEVAALHDDGLTNSEIAVELGLGKRVVDDVIEHELIKRTAQANITPDMLSMTAQKKLELAIKQHKEKLTAEWRIAVSTRVDELLANTIGPKLKKEQDEARWVMKSRKGIMTRKEYGKILACLHPDWVTDPKQKERYADAFRDFTKMEKLLLDEKESPSQFIDIPKTSAEWEERKRQVSAARRAKREGRTQVGSQL